MRSTKQYMWHSEDIGPMNGPFLTEKEAIDAALEHEPESFSIFAEVAYYEIDASVKLSDYKKTICK